MEPYPSLAKRWPREPGNDPLESGPSFAGPLVVEKGVDVRTARRVDEVVSSGYLH